MVLRLLRQFSRTPRRSVAVNYCETKVTTLPNGLRVATEDMGTPTTTVGLWIDCGTRYEKLSEMGTAHFFEHLVFKGSRIMTKQRLTDYAEDTGTLMNAYTSREHTSYYFQGNQQNTGKLIEILADIIQNPNLEKSSINYERMVITAEYDDINLNVQELLFDYIHAYCYGGLDGMFKNSSLSYNILGTKRHITKLITQRMIKDFIRVHYHPSRMVLVATGGVDHEEVVAHAQNHFITNDPYIGPGTPTFERNAQVDPEKDVYTNFWGEKTKFNSCEIRDNQADSETMTGCLTFPTVGWAHSDATVLLLISQMIGVFAHGQGGYQFSKSPFIEKMQKIDPNAQIQAYMSLYNDTGLFGFLFTIFEVAKGKEVVELCFEELRRIADNLPDDELENAKQAMLTNVSLVIDGTQPVADEIGRHLLVYGRRIHYPETKYLVESITKEDVARCIYALLDKNEKALALVGNTSSTPVVFPDVPQINKPRIIHEANRELS